MASSALSQGQKRTSQYHEKLPSKSTSPEKLTLEGQGVPDIPVALPPGYLSCLSCGVAVPYPADENDVIRLSCHGREDQPPQPIPQAQPIAEIAFTRCTGCARRDALARQVVTETNGLSRRFPPDFAQQWLSAALDALMILGQGPAPFRTRILKIWMRSRRCGSSIT